MISPIEKEIGLTLAEYYGMTAAQTKEKSKTLTEEQIRAFMKLVGDDIQAKIWKERNEGTYPPDVEMRAFILHEIVNTPIPDSTISAESIFGNLFQDYITTYPVNASQYELSTSMIGAYGAILNFGLLHRAIDEILEVAFDKFGFMLEHMQTWDYLSPTFGMITGAMRFKMEEFNTK
jgi:hypothetical protein